MRTELGELLSELKGLRAVSKEIQNEAFPFQLHRTPRDMGSLVDEMRELRNTLGEIQRLGIGEGRKRTSEAGLSALDMHLSGPKGKLPG